MRYIMKNSKTIWVVKNIWTTLSFYMALVLVCYFIYKLMSGDCKDIGEIVFLIASIYFNISYILRNFKKRWELCLIYMEFSFLFCEHSYRIESDLNFHMVESRFYKDKEIIHYGDYCHAVTLKCSKCGKRKTIPDFYTPKEDLF